MVALERTSWWPRLDRGDLLIEMAAVCGVLAAATHWLIGQGGLLGACMPPILFFVAGMGVPIARGRGFRLQCISERGLKRDLALLALALCVAFVLLYWGLIAVQHFSLDIPLAVPPAEGQWLVWAVHQVTHVAVPEEVFFRGYLVSTLDLLCQRGTCSGPGTGQMAAILGSALIFGLFHAIAWESGYALLTFFPGAVMAWLFLRTKSLLMPVLFHALANIGYGAAVSSAG